MRGGPRFVRNRPQTGVGIVQAELEEMSVEIRATPWQSGRTGLTAQLRAEFGEMPRKRRRRAGRRTHSGRYPSPILASILGPDALPPECFEQAAVDALFAP